MILTRVIGLTGPIAAGKDEAARLLRRRGAFIIDADRVAHALYASQTPVWRGLVREFGSRILNRGGLVNRKKLAEAVFNDPQKLKALNRIVHPYLKEAIVQIVEGRKSRVDNRSGLVVINAAVLQEIGLADYVDEVWVVTAPQEVRLQRLVRSGMSPADARARLKAQAPLKGYLALADKLIKNDGSPAELRRKVAALPA